MLIDSPLPIDHLTESAIASLPISKLFHPHEGLQPESACQRSERLKYNHFINLLHSTFRFLTILKACFPNKALLTVIESLKPIPPLSFLIFMISHRFQWRPAFASLFFHQKFAIFFLYSLTNWHWNFKNWHGILWYCLHHWFQENFFTCLWYELLLPALQFHVDPIHNPSKHLLFWCSPIRWYSQILSYSF